jgi:hypothetical protein
MKRTFLISAILFAGISTAGLASIAATDHGAGFNTAAKILQAMGKQPVLTIESDNTKFVQEARRGKKSKGNGESGSKRRKVRIPGGSGCDDAGDRAEHPECRA